LTKNSDMGENTHTGSPSHTRQNVDHLLKWTFEDLSPCYCTQ